MALLIFVGILAITGLASSLNIGDSCIPNYPVLACNVSQNLECIDWVCSCNATTKFQRSNFDGPEGLCLLKLDSNCVDNDQCYGTAVCVENKCACVDPDLPSADGTHCIHKSTEPHSDCFNEGFECDDALTCSDGGHCQCNDGFVSPRNETFELGCYASRLQGCVPEDDSTLNTCAEFQRLQCVEIEAAYKCECDDGLVWDENYESPYPDKKGYCLVKAGASCEDISENPEENWTVCVANATCGKESLMCECNEGFDIDPSTSKCRLISEEKLNFGEICIAGNFSQYCDAEQRLYCPSASECGVGDCTCKCLEGYIYSQTRKKCELGHGMRCNDPGMPPCNVDALLSCGADMTCRCNDPATKFDSVLEKCFRPVGEACDVSISDQCHPTSVCRNVEEQPLCWCDPFTQPSLDWTHCTENPFTKILRYNANCNVSDYTSVCDPVRNFVCEDSTCICPGELVYSYNDNECFATFGKPCTPETHPIPPKNMTCNPEQHLTCFQEGTCGCAAGYATEQGVCKRNQTGGASKVTITGSAMAIVLILLSMFNQAAAVLQS